MGENNFLKTMIETIKYGDYENKDELIGILRNSKIKFNNTNIFTSKTWQYFQDIDLRVPIPMLANAKKLQESLNDLVAYIYEETDEYAFRRLVLKPQILKTKLEYKEHEVYFSEIQNTIIQGIRNSKYMIWIAVAWFTDEDIYKELLEKKKEGVNIRIITSDEESNRYLKEKLTKNFNTKFIPKQGRNRLHDKFCIIDLEYVMHGSYNWSKNAKGNEETLTTALDKDFVKEFANKFMELYKK